MLFGCCSPTFLHLGLVLEIEVARFGCQWGRQMVKFACPTENSLPWAGGQAVVILTLGYNDIPTPSLVALYNYNFQVYKAHTSHPT